MRYPSRQEKRTQGASRRRASAVAAGVLVAAAVAACGGSGSTATVHTTATQSQSSTGTSSSTGKKITIAVMGGAASDEFWSTVKNGDMAAGKAVEAAGGKVTYFPMPNYNNFNPDAAKLVADILAAHPSAAVIPDWAPQAQNANIKALVKAGIPVFIYNTGADQLKTVGALDYIGSSNISSGKLAGQQLVAAGSKHVVCINTLPGTTTGSQFCGGLKQGAKGAKETELDLSSTAFGNPSAVTQAIKGLLLKDPSIDGMYTLDAQDATSAALAIKQAGRTQKVRLASQNFDAAGLARIQNGTQTMAVDQEGYAQGYYAVSAAFQYVAYGINIGNVATGPLAITTANVKTAIAGNKMGDR